MSTSRSKQNASRALTNESPISPTADKFNKSGERFSNQTPVTANDAVVLHNG